VVSNDVTPDVALTKISGTFESVVVQGTVLSTQSGRRICPLATTSHPVLTRLCISISETEHTGNGFNGVLSGKSCWKKRPNVSAENFEAR